MGSQPRAKAGNDSKACIQMGSSLEGRPLRPKQRWMEKMMESQECCLHFSMTTLSLLNYVQWMPEQITFPITLVTHHPWGRQRVTAMKEGSSPPGSAGEAAIWKPMGWGCGFSLLPGDLLASFSITCLLTKKTPSFEGQKHGKLFELELGYGFSTWDSWLS